MIGHITRARILRKVQLSASVVEGYSHGAGSLLVASKTHKCINELLLSLLRVADKADAHGQWRILQE